jgi:spermidine synthase
MDSGSLLLKASTGRKKRGDQRAKLPAIPEPPPPQGLFSGLPILLLCFSLSGAAGLIYQVAWSNALGLIFGHTAYAVATVLAVFMGGLTAGSAWLGKWSEKSRRPVAAYGWLEIGVAATGAASLVGLRAVRAVYLAAYPTFANHSVFLVALRVAGAAVVLFVPTFLMGGTLPVLIQGLSRTSAELGRKLARLYWVNTAGAVAGAFAAGFLFLPAIGLQLTVAVAVALNLIAGALALKIGSSEAAAVELPSTFPSKVQEPPAGLPSRFLLICFAAVGATAMAYEIGWTRLLATQLGSSTYAFTLMLVTFLTGIVLGSAIFERWSRRHRAGQMTFAWTQTFIALAALGALIFFAHVPEVLPPILRATHRSFQGLVLAQFSASALVMLPTALIFGFNFPAVIALVAGRQSSTASVAVGRAYAWNTFGAIVGAIASGFWLLPRLGAFHLLAAAAAINIALAVILSLVTVPRRIGALAFNAALMLLAGFIAFSNFFYDPAVAAFNPVLYSSLYNPALSLQQDAHMVNVPYFKEGLNSTIAVTQTDGFLSLRTNGKVDASNHDVVTQLLLGHLGGLAHPAPRRVLVIGFGGGMTVSALARYPDLERLDCVEIEPAVLGAAPLLTSLNRNVLQDPRVHIIFDDARNFLFTTHERYDLIVSEPSNPWVAGVATLFTQEFYRAAQDRLAPGGIFVQWVQAYSLYPNDLRMVLGTFLSDFHDATLWHGDAPDLLIIAPTPPAPAILKHAQSVWNNQPLQDDFRRLGMEEPAGLFGFFLLDDASLREFSSGAQLNTDDRTLLEYRAPRALLVERLEEQNRREILLAQKNILPQELTADSRDAALTAAATTSVNLQDKDGADRFLRALEGHPVTLNIAIARGRSALLHENFDGAARNFDAALALDPNSTEAQWGRAEANGRSGNGEAAQQQLQRILQRDPKNLQALESLKQLATDTSNWTAAADIERRIIAANPSAGADAYAQLAEMLLRGGKLPEAYDAMQACLARDPYNFQTHLSLAEIFSEQKKWPEAREHLEFARHYFPDGDPEIYTLLYQFYGATGNPRAAADAVRFGLHIFPDDADLQRLSLLP